MALMTARPSSAKFSVEDPCFLDTEEHPDWQVQFGNHQPVKLEIGFGMGDFLIEMATREPDSNFVGIDFSQDGIRKILARINNLHLKNIRVVFGDVREKIPLLFKDGELDTVYINFPDPWPRKRHFKRRLIKPGLVSQIAQKLSPKGRVHVATDSEPYALEILEYFNAESLLQNSHKDSGFLSGRGHLPKTKYEKSFIYAGDKICYLEHFRSGVDETTKELVEENKNDIGNQDKTLSNDEFLIQKFTEAEVRAKDACDLKLLGDHLAEAGDKQWAEKVYRKAEEKVEDSLDLNWLAYSIFEALGDKEWARELYKKAEEMSESSLDLNWLAYSISETLGDKDWAKKLFEKAETKPENIRELCDRADSISEVLGDKDWELKVYKKAEEKAQEYSDFYELADSIFANLGDPQWARELLKKAEGKAEDCSDLLGVVERLCEKLGEKEWAERVYKNAEILAQDSNDFCCLSDSLYQNLKDEEWAKGLYKIAADKAGESYEFRWLANSLCEKPGNTNWARELYKKAEDIADAFYEFCWLADSLRQNLGDVEWARQVYLKAETRARDPYDFNRLALL